MYGPALLRKRIIHTAVNRLCCEKHLPGITTHNGHLPRIQCKRPIQGSLGGHRRRCQQRVSLCRRLLQLTRHTTHIHAYTARCVKT